MLPVLFQIGPLIIYSYGFFLAIAYLVGTFVFWREGKARGFKEEKLIDFSVVSLVAAVIGGRIFYGLLNFNYFARNPWDLLAFWEGGFSFYGSVVLVLIVGAYLVRAWRWDFFQVADFAALAVLVAIVLGKIGSFLSGNDYGALTSLPWGIESQYLEGVRHPVQLYEAFYNLVLFLVLYRLYRRNLNRLGDLRSGSVFLYFIFFNSLGRFVFELVRGDSTYLGPFRLASLLAFLLATISLLVLYYYQFRNFRDDVRMVSRYFLGANLHLRNPFRKRN